jgi:hypothetical protein
VVERGSLENCWRRKALVGSNPTPSAFGVPVGRVRSVRVEADAMSRKLDIGGTLSQAFSTYGSQAGVLLPVAFGLFLIVAVVNWLVAGSLILFPIGMAVTT